MSEYHALMRNRIAELIANNSSLRKQGVGVVAVTRKRIKQLDLASFVVSSQAEFQRRLDAATTTLKELQFDTARKIEYLSP